MSRFPFADSGDARAGEPAPPAWMTEALRAPAAERIDARTRIMARVQALPVPHRLVAPMPMARWRRRGTLSGLGGVVLTAALALMLTVREGERFSLAARVHTAALVLGDSAVPVSHDTHDASARTKPDRGNSRIGDRLLDTLRVVELVVRGVGLQDVVWRRAGDAHGNVRTVALARISSTEWRARTLVPRDAVDVTLVVNNVALAPTPVTPPLP
ncbi:MAG TPA: hypothetical protein DGD08_16900 [Gemmatimonas aurantiaca]|uniref:Uncharacterized protein n=2 Tax=Gemmatimonas aurantiaca TaxID=173480 RepID=C1A3K9_GEMAT|nr:hypothetical protein [Gemmatimonas aurantiaca]BAH37086.1 hypothetical protein GAU_0044 [Gemmatimonas aurantiaca T-27]HCT58881.1 hypothetical protein [Gemmatimonas aurantiaca]